MTVLDKSFYAKNTLIVAKELIGKVIYHKFQKLWLKAQIIETEAYLMEEKGSHASLGYSEKKKALFMPPGTIYMYYSRGKDSFNISTGNDGDAVLIKSGVPYIETSDDNEMVEVMKKLNPLIADTRTTQKLCSGQTLLAKALNLKVKDWDSNQFDENKLIIKGVGYIPEKLIQTKRLGIPKGRDEDLMYRFIDYRFLKSCTKNPMQIRAQEGIDYSIIKVGI